MLYSLLKIPAQFALWIYCRHLTINRKEFLQSKDPLLIAANHPNSFLDAIILATIFKRPIYSLARGDAFANNFFTRILTSLKILPVYRISEGVENLEHNYTTFEACKHIFKEGGIVLIFSEGRCINEWHLRPLKKGTARLAISAWQEGIPLTILPTGLNYNSFHSFGKNVQLNFGEPITAKDFNAADSQGNSINTFNGKLQTQLQQLVFEIDDKETVKEKFSVPASFAKKIFLFIPATLGWLLHFSLYYPLKKFTWSKAAHNGHFDSILIGMLFIAYPIYLLLLSFLLSAYIGWYSVLIFLFFPFCAWSYVQLKHQF